MSIIQAGCDFFKHATSGDKQGYALEIRVINGKKNVGVGSCLFDHYIDSGRSYMQYGYHIISRPNNIYMRDSIILSPSTVRTL